MSQANLHRAKKTKNDEFYTQWADIENEIMAYFDYNPEVFKNKTILLPCDDPEWSNFTKFFAQNFERFGLKKLISTSFAYNSKKLKIPYQLTLFEENNSLYDSTITKERGKIFTLTRDKNKNGKIDIQDLEWKYLKCDGDFRSNEVKKLRDKADIIITNPPFSLFREFLAWIVEADKQFAMISNKNAITYKEVFPLIKENKIWVGVTPMSKDILFDVPPTYAETLLNTGRNSSSYRIVDGVVKGRSQSIWLTNIEHGRRHQPLRLMTEADNIKHSKHKEVRGIGYKKYDNYDAIEVPFTDAIPSDFNGAMGVPISFLDKYCPEQFEIIGATESEGKGFSCGLWNNQYGVAQATINGIKVFKRIFIKSKK